MLPYLEVTRDQISEEDIKANVEVPNLIGLTYKEAKKALEEVGLEISLRLDTEDNNVKNEVVISNQIPMSGVQILQGGSVIVE